MTSTQELLDAAKTARTRRARVWKAALTLVVVVGAAWVVIPSVYAPLAPGSSGGIQSPSIKVLTDGVERTRYILTAPRGQTGTVQYSLRNEGMVPVRLHGLPADEPWLLRVRWAPSVGRDNLWGGHPDEVKEFPVTLKPDEEITLWVTVTKPPCQNDGYSTITSIPISWSALGRQHVYQFQLEGDSLPISVCYPKEALNHIASR
ncbi:hypothetical protein [Actinopolymorpha alba]|uniref:hypothetical protein n=1 Tax=Actinopolymorpha alba TaxID=533267 RepID=UPI0003644071|nr:hypothetical protein [Actinopolymorpha alba]